MSKLIPTLPTQKPYLGPSSHTPFSTFPKARS